MAILTRRVFAFSQVSFPSTSIQSSYAMRYRRICSHPRYESTYLQNVGLHDVCRRTAHASGQLTICRRHILEHKHWLVCRSNRFRH